MEESILEVLKQIKPDVDFEASKDFVEDGLLDSFEIVDLVSELEDEFSIEISGRDIIPENFISLETIAALARKYTEGE